jgi:hypothetical protein
MYSAASVAGEPNEAVSFGALIQVTCWPPCGSADCASKEAAGRGNLRLY